VLLNENSQKKLKKIRESGKFCCVTVKSDYMYVWDVYLTEAKQTNDKHEITYRSGAYENLNDAINSIYSQIESLLSK
jgi:hypothetical protein